MDHIKGIEMPQQYVDEAKEGEKEWKWQQAHKPNLFTIDVNVLWRRSSDPAIAIRQASLLGQINDLKDQIEALVPEVNGVEIDELKKLHAPLYAEARRCKDALRRMPNIVGAAENHLREADLRFQEQLHRHHVAVGSVPKISDYPTKAEYRAYDKRVAEAEEKMKQAGELWGAAEQHLKELLSEHEDRKKAFDIAKAAEAKFRAKIDLLEGKAPVGKTSSVSFSTTFGLQG